MINLKNKVSDDDHGLPTEVMEAPAYPWGTQITLEDEHIEALGLDLSVGDSVTIQAVAKVVEQSQNESENHSHTSVSFQITEIDMSRGESLDASDVLYAEIEL
jgi:hypothetical protein